MGEIGSRGAPGPLTLDRLERLKWEKWLVGALHPTVDAPFANRQFAHVEPVREHRPGSVTGEPGPPRGGTGAEARGVQHLRDLSFSRALRRPLKGQQQPFVVRG